MGVDQEYLKFRNGSENGDLAIKFATHYFGDACPDKPPDFHRLIMWWFFCDMMKAVCAAPRGHAKSTMCSMVGVMTRMALRLDHNMILFSCTLDQAIDLLNTIKLELMSNERFCKDWGIHPDKARTWNQDQIELILDGGFPFRITAKSIGSSMRGTKFGHWRPSFALLDDVEDDENITTVEMRNKMEKWLFATLMPAMDPKHIIRFVGTVLHEDSLLNKLLNNRSWASLFFAAHSDNFYEVLWPERFSKETLMRIRQEYEDVGRPELYAMEYLNKCIPVGGSFFDMTKVKKVDQEPDDVLYYTASDLAISEKDRADWTTIITVALSKKEMFLVDVKRGRWDAQIIIDNMLATERQYHPTVFLIEKGQISQAITPLLELEEQRYATYLNRELVIPLKDKQARARTFQGIVRQGLFNVVRGIDNLQVFFHEMANFGSTRYDDTIDPVSYLCMKVNQVLNPVNEKHQEIVKEAQKFTRIVRHRSMIDADWGL